MAGYIWLSSFFCIFMDLNFVSVHILKVQKKNKAITAILTEQGWLIKDLLYLQKYLL